MEADVDVSVHGEGGVRGGQRAWPTACGGWAVAWEARGRRQAAGSREGGSRQQAAGQQAVGSRVCVCGVPAAR